MSRPTIKICGITRVEDALLAESLGADHIGLIFASQSPRCLTVERAIKIRSALTHAQPVGVFVDHDLEATLEIAKKVGLSVIQHHQKLPEKPDPYGYFRVLSVQDAGSLGDISQDSLPDKFLLDTYVKGVPGGTGQRFDWNLVANLTPELRAKVILAGGLNPDNVAEAVATGASGIDVSSGVEPGPKNDLRNDPGIKDPDLLKRFIGNAKRFVP